jgi:hypothetical protein
LEGTNKNLLALKKELSKKNYLENGKLNKRLVIENMKRLFVFTHVPYIFYVKTIINNEFMI